MLSKCRQRKRRQTSKKASLDVRVSSGVVSVVQVDCGDGFFAQKEAESLGFCPAYRAVLVRLVRRRLAVAATLAATPVLPADGSGLQAEADFRVFVKGVNLDSTFLKRSFLFVTGAPNFWPGQIFQANLIFASQGIIITREY